MDAAELSEYRRAVEDHLTRVNGGHLVRIVGTGFEVVRGWALSGIPLSVAFRGIEAKADRHRLGQTLRPLRIEFCDTDVQELYAGWRRAVGVPTDATEAREAGEEAASKKPPALTRQIDRAIDRLSHVTGRLDLPESFTLALGDLLGELIAARDDARGARGPAKEAVAARLPSIDERMLTAARAAAGTEAVAALEIDAARDLSAFRERLSGDAWRSAIDVTVNRLLRDRFGLPIL